MSEEGNMGKQLLVALNRRINNLRSALGFNVSTSDREEKAVTAVKRDPIMAENFLQRLKQKKSDKYLNIEVRAIVRNQDEFPYSVSMTPENVMKNVNQDVVPYDHARVVLRDAPHGENDYINASYIEGYNQEREYIASQGPKQKTVPAFWHMVWQEDVHCIVMATGLFENASQQCDKYWGDVFSMQKYVRHGDIHIWLDSSMEIAQLTIRNFRIKRDGAREERSIKHFEMVGFNDEATDPGFLLDCIRRVNTYTLGVTGPILVHCRCGGGKTSVFIALDCCLKQLEKEGCIDIYSTVLHLRKFRKNMVRTLYQYRLIYEAAAMHIQCGTTVVPSAQLPAVVQRLAVKDPRTRLHGFEKEHQIIKNIATRLSIGDCAGGHRSENRTKSRDIMLLPPERARPYLLTSESSDNGTDFINAVFIDGYYQENNFLVTQWPMQNTVNDIWRLIYDYKIMSLVVLNDVKYSRSHPCFWPTDLDVEHKYGPIGVRYLGCQKFPNIVIRAFAVRKNLTCMSDITAEYAVVKTFQLTCWPAKEKTPHSSKSMIYLMGCVEEWQQRTNPLNPVCIMSKDGYTRCGVYCVTNICLDQLKAEGEVDVFGAVRIVKKNRPDLVPNVVEYVFCYSFVVTVLDIMQEDKPKIVITGPASRGGQVNRGYHVDMSGLHGNLFNNDEFTNLITKSSQLSFHQGFLPALDNKNLAAKGHITTQRAALAHLQIPSIDSVSVSSADSASDQGETIIMNKNVLPNCTVANGVGTGSRYEENNNVRVQSSNGNLTNGGHAGNCPLQMASPSAFYPSASSSRNSNSEIFRSDFVPTQKPLRDSRTKRPTLRRQDATDSDAVELKMLETKNQTDESLSLQISPL
ncbi:receptor-type tyrosine-protein phosphatase mu-like [Pecten maximus]|uniref:receptor-type tyrosine-protein phosphatase mu-like n=1 Tax=Pecten maximus TaxID=6579 RepID=UPI001457F2C0|nr:receptor-type tyrosine-protein phosphatase mu-like [Pecten maximus]